MVIFFQNPSQQPPGHHGLDGAGAGARHYHHQRSYHSLLEQPPQLGVGRSIRHIQNYNSESLRMFSSGENLDPERPEYVSKGPGMSTLVL